MQQRGGGVGQAWRRLTLRLEDKLRKSMYTLGLFIGTHPHLMIGLATLVALTSGLGMMVVKTENDIEKLWVPAGRPAVGHKQVIADNFRPPPTMASFLVVADDDAGSLATKERLLAQLSLHDKVLAITVTDPATGVALTFEDLCFRTPSDVCATASPLDWWRFNATLITSDGDHGATLGTETLASTGAPLDLNTLVGGYTQGAGDRVETAQAMRHLYPLDASNDRDVRREWQTRFLQVIEAETSLLPGVRALRWASRSSDDELDRAITNDIYLVAVCFVVMLVYSSSVLGKFDIVESKFVLGILGVLCVFLGMLMAFGLCAAIGVIFSSITQILPFLILGIGVDDIFILVSIYERLRRNGNRQDSLPKRLATAMSMSGIPITMTSLTSFMAFSLAAIFGDLLAVQAFAIYAAVSVACVYLLQLTLFPALLHLDAVRISRQRLDLLPCVTLRREDVRESTQPAGPPGTSPPQLKLDTPPVARLMRNHIGPALTRRGVKYVVVALFTVLMIISCIGASQLEQGIKTPDDIVPDDSYMIPYFRSYNRFFDHLGMSVALVMRDVDYGNAADRAALAKLIGAVEEDKTIAPETVTGWYPSFLSWVPSNAGNATLSDGVPVVRSEFFSLLSTFLADPTAGQHYQDDVVWTDDASKSSIRIARLRTRHPPPGDTLAQKDAMLSLRATLATVEGINVFAFTTDYLYLEQFVGMVDQVALNLVVAASAVFLVTLFFLTDVATTLIVFVAVVMIDLDLLGVMYIWDVKLNSVSLTVLILAIGLSVDYCAHVVHAFVAAQGSPDQRVIVALAEMGSSVLNGATTTLLGVLVLSVANASVFRVFFRMLFSLIFLALLHGMLFLPVLLSWLAPAAHPPAVARAQSLSVFGSTRRISVMGRGQQMQDLTASRKRKLAQSPSSSASSKASSPSSVLRSPRRQAALSPRKTNDPSSS